MIRRLGGRSLHNIRSIAQTFVGVDSTLVFNVSSHLYEFVADLIACRLGFYMSDVACRVSPRLWSGALVCLL